MTRKPALLYWDFCWKIWHENIQGGNAKTTRTAKAVKKTKTAKTAKTANTKITKTAKNHENCENRENRKTARTGKRRGRLTLLLAAFLVFFRFCRFHACHRSGHVAQEKKLPILLHQWIRSAIRDSQQPSSPIGFLFLKLPPPPCRVLLG